VPAARVHHHVAADRHRRRYFLSRCWHEGRSKAAVAEQVGAGDALTSERTYARTVLPRGAARGVRAASRGDVHGLQRAAAIVSGAGLAAGGYATEWMRRTAKAVREREEVAA
jgi:hypothetical protein